LLTVIALSSAQALAQEEDPLVRSAARDLATQGAEAYDAGDYATALDRFGRAVQLYPAPTLAVMQARSLVGLGRWVEAAEAYHAAERMPLAADAAEPLQQAVRDAAREGADIESRLPRIEIRLQPADPQLAISVDGQPLPLALLNVQRSMDPGVHRVEATVDGASHFQTSVELAERQQVLVEIPPLPSREVSVQPVTREVAPKAKASPPPAAREPGSSTPNWITPVAFSAGGAGVGIAVVSGILAADRHTRLKGVCTEDLDCPESSQPDLDAFNLYRGLFVLGTALGVAGLGVGTYFVIWGPDASQTVALDVGPGSASLTGRF
jgi:hypothetical protein